MTNNDDIKSFLKSFTMMIQKSLKTLLNDVIKKVIWLQGL